MHTLSDVTRRRGLEYNKNWPTVSAVLFFFLFFFLIVVYFRRPHTALSRLTRPIISYTQTSKTDTCWNNFLLGELSLLDPLQERITPGDSL